LSILTRGSELAVNAIPLFVKLRRLSMRSYKTIPEEEVEDIKARFERLGPSFIKLGQMLSCHYDVLPPIIAEALSHLLDELPPSPPCPGRAQTRAPLYRCFGSILVRP